MGFVAWVRMEGFPLGGGLRRARYGKVYKEGGGGLLKG